MKKAVFLDKDGTLVENVHYNADPDKVRLTPYAAVICASTIKFTGGREVEAEPQEEGDEPGLPTPPKPAKHAPYALEPLLAAISAVGYDGTLAIEYRGTGDPTVGVKRTRQALEAVLRLDEGSE